MSTDYLDQQPIGRTVGTRIRPEFELNLSEAYRRGRVLDRMLHAAVPPCPRGVTRGSHEYFNRVDAERQMQIARGLNAA